MEENRGDHCKEGGPELTNENLDDGKERKEKGQGIKRFEYVCQSGWVGLN